MPISAEGLITTASENSFATTLGRLETALQDKGLTLFARIDHAAGAAQADMELAPTMLLIFGNPKGGTPLMQSIQQIGLQLPLKLLVWEDATGETRLTYDDPLWLAQRFGLDPAMPAVVAMSKALTALADAAGRAETSPGRA
jgi:uncharacterized protein (DUF302 family)